MERHGHMNSEEILAQIKKICLSITESSYDNGIQQGYELLIQLHDLGLEKETIYQALFQYYNGFRRWSFLRDCMVDIMDFIVGWCSRDKYVWKEH